MHLLGTDNKKMMTYNKELSLDTGLLKMETNKVTFEFDYVIRLKIISLDQERGSIS